nr:unnamed protein product [Naegleria fowleri]
MQPQRKSFIDRVTLHLDLDFTSQRQHSNSITSTSDLLIRLLSNKFFHHYQKSFSNNFDLISTLGTPSQIGSDNFHFARPTDVKLSYKTRCILVCDSHNQRIQLFDMDTKRFKATIHTPHIPQYLCIESNNHSKYGKAISRQHSHTCEFFKKDFDEDSVMVSCLDHCVYKFNIRKCIESFQESSKNLVKYFLTSLVGMLIPPLKNTTEYVWKSGITGECGNSLQHFSRPSSMALVEKGKFLHVNFASHQSEQHDEELQVNSSITVDSRSSDIRHVKKEDRNYSDNLYLLLVCDSLNHRIKVLEAHTGQALFSITHYQEWIQNELSKQTKFFTPTLIVVSPHSQDILLVEMMKSNSSRIVLLRQGDFSHHGMAHVVCFQKSVSIKGLLGDLDFSGCMYVADRNGISIRNVRGQLKSTPFDGHCEVYSPCGMCLNEQNGELYVLDYVDHTLQIFK